MVCPEAESGTQDGEADAKDVWERGWQRLLQALEHDAGERVFVFGPDGRCRLVEGDHGRMSGCVPVLGCLGCDDGRDWRQRLPERVGAVVEDLQHLVRAGVPTSFEVECCGRHYRFRGLSLRDAAPSSDAVLVLGRDVTQTDAALQALQGLGVRLRELSERDVLLDIANRRCFERSLQREWRRARREAQWLALMLVDLDDFKACNDRFGHAFGDLCLQRVASVLQQAATRPADLVARYGGDEFAVLLPDTDETGARLLAVQMHTLLQCQQIPGYATLTLTIGVAAAGPGQLATAGELLVLADRALYRGKTQGRNCTVAASELAT